MPSFFSWLDYSEHEKRKMLDVINLFRERDTRDELGIGTVRDAFSDMLFPGTSTIQTRAKYFLFIPWMYLDIERRKVPSERVADEARRTEIKLINALAESDDRDGIIGIEARASLKRLPSNIYWQGLGTWGIRLISDSQDSYHRSLNYFYESSKRIQRNDDGEPVSGNVMGNWHGNIPGKPSEFPGGASFSLSKEEAEYLSERVFSRAQNTLMSFLISQKEELPAISFPWEITHFAESTLPGHLQEQLIHARNFSTTIYGAALLYNLMLSQKADGREDQDDLIIDYEEAFAEWADEIKALEPELQAWDRKTRFWEIVKQNDANIPLQTKKFIDTWLDIVFASDSLKDMARNDFARKLIKNREITLKRNQARLDNQRALEQWSGAAGTIQLNYRWRRPVLTIINDIVKGLNS
ncbi:MAG TPA: DUF6361 family protein [Alphaproteobacteria bacterium]|nr:DUF6361 family protein [Alphaproteobacteria bacterium]